MLCVGVIWSAAFNYRTFVIDLIKETASVKKTFDILFKTKEEYEDFVRDIYSLDSIDKWNLDIKTGLMFKHQPEEPVYVVTIVFLEIEEGESFYHDYHQRFFFKNLKSLKAKVRDGLSQTYEIDQNILFHMSEDEKEYRLMDDYLKNYCLH